MVAILWIPESVTVHEISAEFIHVMRWQDEFTFLLLRIYFYQIGMNKTRHMISNKKPLEYTTGLASSRQYQCLSLSSVLICNTPLLTALSTELVHQLIQSDFTLREALCARPSRTSNWVHSECPPTTKLSLVLEWQATPSSLPSGFAYLSSRTLPSGVLTSADFVLLVVCHYLTITPRFFELIPINSLSCRLQPDLTKLSKGFFLLSHKFRPALAAKAFFVNSARKIFPLPYGHWLAPRQWCTAFTYD